MKLNKAVLSKFMENFGDKFDKKDPESLNTISEILQPMVAQTCAIDGDLDKLKKLVEEGLDLNASGRNGKTALHIAIAQSDIAMVEYIIQRENINLNVIDKDGNTPLFYAWLNGNQTIASMLTFKNALFETNQTKLADILCQKALVNDLVSIELFDKAGANLEATNYDKRTCGHIAAAEGHQDILYYLSKESKFNFELKDRWGNTVLDEISDEILKQTVRQYFLSNEIV